jgi:single-strand DNA-binding protein
MSGSVNRAIIMGNVGRDPEIKTLTSGDQIATLSIATEDSWTDKRTGERQKRTEWHRIVVFNQGLVKVIDRYIKKGARLHVIGEVRTREWTGRDGEKRLSTEVVLPNFGGELTIVSTPRDGGESRAPSETRQPDRTDAKGNPQWERPDGDLDDQIPF